MHHRPSRRAALSGVASATIAASLLLSGCGSDTADDPAPAGGDRISVVASTNVYGAIARQIGGDAVEVTAILDNPSADPHSFEAAPADQLTIAKAQLVIANGGGYDDFAATMVDAADPAPVLIDAVEVSGLSPEADDTEEGGEAHDGEAHDGEAHDSGAAEEHAEADGHEHEHEHGAFNEHVFYHLGAMEKLGTAIADELGELDPQSADTFTANASAFADRLADLHERAHEIAEHSGDLNAIVTEPVADYLLDDAGVTDVTPAGYTEAIESETDPAAKDLAAVDELIKGGSVGLLVYNEQTSGPVIEQLRDWADEAGVPVLAVTETLPEGVTSYPEWISGVLDRLSDAVAG